MPLPAKDRTRSLGICAIWIACSPSTRLCSHQNIYKFESPLTTSEAVVLVQPVSEIIKDLRCGRPLIRKMTPWSPTLFPRISTDLTWVIELAISLQLREVILLFLISRSLTFLNDDKTGISLNRSWSVMFLLLSSITLLLCFMITFFHL